MNGNDPYRAMLDLPHHQSATRRHMRMAERAAQFAPFAALNGYDDAIRETARLVNTEADGTEREKP